MTRLLERLGRLVVHRRWVIIIGWVGVLAALLATRADSGGEFLNDYTVPHSESSTGTNLLERTFPAQSGYAGQIVFHAAHGTVATRRPAVDLAMARIARLPHVVAVASPFARPALTVSPDGTIAYGTVSWDVAPASLNRRYLADLDDAVRPARSAGLQTEYGGGAGQIGQAAHDGKSEIIGLSCALLLLLFMFGSIAAAAIPLASAIFSVGAGISLLGILAAATTFPTAAPTVATLLGLGVAVDYGLLLVARHREQLDGGVPTATSIMAAERTAGASILVAGGTVVIAILGLYVSGVPFVGAMGAASAIVVAVTMLAALTLVPAFMSVAGASVRRAGSRRRHRLQRRTFFDRWGATVSRRPWPWALVATGVLVVLALPFLSMRLGQLDAGTNPTTQSMRRAYDLVAKGFGPGANGPLKVVVRMPQGNPARDGVLLKSLGVRLKNTRNVALVTPPAVNSTGTVATFAVVPATSPQDEATTALVDRLRNSVLPQAGVQTYVTGPTAGYVDFTDKTARRMPWLIGTVVALSCVLLTLAFRSVVIAVKAAALNLLSVGAAYGVIVAVFQWGWGSQLVGISEPVPIPAFVPMLTFAIVFGLSMDYEVFLLSRVREVWARTGDSPHSVAVGICSTARVISTAAAIMVVVFASFVLDIDPAVKMLAIGMAVAVLIDASIVRLVLVPSLMSLLGGAAWWMPRWLDRITPDLRLETLTRGAVAEMLPPPRSPADADDGAVARHGSARPQ